MQVALGGVQHQPGERLNEQQRQENEVASASANSRPPRTWQVPPCRPRATALAGGRRCHSGKARDSRMPGFLFGLAERWPVDHVSPLPCKMRTTIRGALILKALSMLRDSGEPLVRNGPRRFPKYRQFSLPNPEAGGSGWKRLPIREQEMAQITRDYRSGRCSTRAGSKRACFSRSCSPRVVCPPVPATRVPPLSD